MDRPAHLAEAEAVLQELGLHYHVVINCGADLGLGQVKKYDLEAWMRTRVCLVSVAMWCSGLSSNLNTS